jgi:hypothetical protein
MTEVQSKLEGWECRVQRRETEAVEIIIFSFFFSFSFLFETHEYREEAEHYNS